MPVGSGEFTRKMGMLVCKDNLGFGMRSWRYAAVIDDGVVKAWFEEPGFSDNCETDPYGESSPQNILEKLTDELTGDQTKAACPAPDSGVRQPTERSDERRVGKESLSTGRY